MWKRLFVVCLAIMAGLIVSGCMAPTTAGWDLENSKADYKDCLKAYPNNESKCESLKKLYEVDKDAVESLRGGRIKVDKDVTIKNEK